MGTRILFTLLLFTVFTNAQEKVLVRENNVYKQIPVDSIMVDGVTLAEIFGIISDTYTLTETLTTSAGVYDSNDYLLRVLWVDSTQVADTYSIPEWDGLDNDGNAVTGSYVKVIAHDVQYDWEGARIGNTSTNETGVNQYHGLGGFFRFHISDDDIAYYTNTYNEQRQTTYKVDLSTPQVPSPAMGKNYVTKFVTSDNDYVYWGNQSSEGNQPTFVLVTKKSDDTAQVFSESVSATVQYGPTYTNALNYTDVVNSDITGLARNGDFLFIARQRLDQIDVLDMTQGGLKVQTITTVTAPRELVSGVGGVWMVHDTKTVSRFPINVDGTLATSDKTISTLDDPLAMDITPNGLTLSIVDAGTKQQVRFFTISDLSEGTAFGQLGGYDGSPLVENDKFYFTDQKTVSWTSDIWIPQINHGSISYETDGSYWVLDVGNNRMMHFDSSNTYIEKIQYIPDWLITAIDVNDPTKVLNNMWEYEIDYTETDVSNAWTLKYNWGYDILDARHNGFSYFNNIITIDGHTFGFIDGLTDFHNEIVEFTSTGLRFTGIEFQTAFQGLEWLNNGDIVMVNPVNLGDTTTWKKYTYTGLNGSDNPTFSTSTNILEKVSTATDPTYQWNGIPSIQFFDDNELLVFHSLQESSGLGEGYHIGLIDINTGDWIWKGAKSTGTSYLGNFPLDGRFDSGNYVNNAGSKALVFGDNLIWGYYGEFWKGGFQTNRYNHMHKSGLFLKNFGTDWNQNPITGAGTPGSPSTTTVSSVFTAFDEMAGNAFEPIITIDPTSTDRAFMYHADEAWHGGIHRWKISGLDSIKEFNLSIE